MADLKIKRLTPDDLIYVSDRVTHHFGSDQVISRGQVHDCLSLEGYVAWLDEERVGLVQFHVALSTNALEVVTLVSDRAGRGIGRALLLAIIEYCHAQSVSRCWLITTNNNEVAIRFYQSLGWQLVAVHSNAMVAARMIKPEIPEFDSAGVSISDELEFQYPFELSE